jgi:FGGY family of carbohydrate kinases, N-terminal domain
MRDLILAIDQGTQSVRAMIFDLRGTLVAKSQIHIQPYYSRQAGWDEQDCEYWARFCEACRNLSPVTRATILCKTFLKPRVLRMLNKQKLSILWIAINFLASDIRSQGFHVLYLFYRNAQEIIRKYRKIRQLSRLD